MATYVENTVVISVPEYRKLVSDSATLQVIKNYLEKEQYVSSSTLQNILNIKKEGENNT